MRFNLKKSALVALAAHAALLSNLGAQSKSTDFRIDEPLPVTNQNGQKILLEGMQGSSVIFKFAGMPDSGASIPIGPDSQIKLIYDYPDNFSDVQYDVLNGNYERALRSIRDNPIRLLHFLSVPPDNCNFHLYSEIYYRALVYEGNTQEAIKATKAIPWSSSYLPPAFVQHASTLLNRMVGDENINASQQLLNILQENLPVSQFSSLALPVADKLRVLGENKIVEGIYTALSQSDDEEISNLGEMWTAYNLANIGNTEEAKRLLDKIGELTPESPLFAIYCLANGRLALTEKNSVQALRFLSRAMVRTTIADSYKPEIYFLMIQSYMMDKNTVPATRLAKEMKVFYPNNMWRKSIVERYPELKEENQ